MNHHIDTPVLLAISRLPEAESFTARQAMLLAGPDSRYDLATRLFVGSNGHFRTGFHGSRHAVFYVSEERAADLARYYLTPMAQRHREHARALRWLIRDEPDLSEEELYAAHEEAAHHEREARAIEQRIASLPEVA